MLNPKQTQCIKLMIDGTMTQKQIASEIGVSENTITNWKKNDDFMAAYNEGLKESMKYIASVAFQTQRELLGARSEMVRYLVAKDMLDRAGFKPVEKVEQEIDMDLNISVDYGDE